MARERREGLVSSRAETIDQMIRALNSTRRNSRIYVKLVSSEPGAVLNGATMPALPPSVLAVLDSNRRGSGIRRLRQATLDEWEIETDYAVSGSRVLSVNVEGK